MADSWEDDFTSYATAPLNGQSGWSGDNTYVVDATDYVEFHKVSTNGTFTIDKAIDLDLASNYKVSGWLGLHISDISFAHAGFIVLDSTGKYLFGLRIAKNTDHIRAPIYDGWNNTFYSIEGAGITNGVLYPFEVAYNTVTGSYTQFWFNGYDYINDPAFTTIPTGITGMAAHTVRLHSQTCNLNVNHYSLYDDFKVWTVTGGYATIPHWQKTDFGMRPCY